VLRALVITLLLAFNVIFYGIIIFGLLTIFMLNGYLLAEKFGHEFYFRLVTSNCLESRYKLPKLPCKDEM